MNTLTLDPNIFQCTIPALLLLYKDELIICNLNQKRYIYLEGQYEYGPEVERLNYSDDHKKYLACFRLKKRAISNLYNVQRRCKSK